ncbi:metal ABC transporter ATP-binding protein [Sagittula stellata]|uniref:Zinc/manganese/iron ABC transporter, ATP-binding protein n=1 Tax=Sagittula stellata (strain ATCC 700073 / DSM 11524 / E-37) TaxID=388399 RepID=A3K554_SAGS3|nr:metal ABC transporter ATP-binding protein [Sagittula stellata]EBA07655.1 zinc/manganese/iron ABC transporter, ATP-binding protein [Sagittula stellata E-37]
MQRSETHGLDLATSAGQPVTEDLSAAPLALRGLTVSYGGEPVIFSVDMTLIPGTMTAIIGPNGAGKSTLLKAALGVIKPLAGRVTAWGAPLEAARHRIAYVPQRASIDWDFPTTVMDVVLMGLWRELGLLRRTRKTHRDAALACLARVGMDGFADRQIGQLSGGQQQRVFLARALAQKADLYMLDEPFAGVDAATESAIISVLHALRDEGRTVLSVHHDLATVPRYFDRVFLINRRRVAEGPTDTNFTEKALTATYGGRLPDTRLPEPRLPDERRPDERRPQGRPA